MQKMKERKRKQKESIHVVIYHKMQMLRHTKYIMLHTMFNYAPNYNLFRIFFSFRWLRMYMLECALHTHGGRHSLAITLFS